MKILPTLVLLGCATLAMAQTRSIPQDAKRGEIRHLQGTAIEIDGRPQQLSAGAQIRDAANLIIVPNALPPRALVRYRTEPSGLVHRVWILTPQEAAQPDKVDSR